MLSFLELTRNDVPISRQDLVASNGLVHTINRARAQAASAAVAVDCLEVQGGCNQAIAVLITQL